MQKDLKELESEYTALTAQHSVLEREADAAEKELVGIQRAKSELVALLEYKKRYLQALQVVESKEGAASNGGGGEEKSVKEELDRLVAELEAQVSK